MTSNSKGTHAATGWAEIPQSEGLPLSDIPAPHQLRNGSGVVMSFEDYAHARRCVNVHGDLVDFAETILERLTDGRRDVSASTMEEWASEARAVLARSNHDT